MWSALLTAAPRSDSIVCCDSSFFFCSFVRGLGSAVIPGAVHADSEACLTGFCRFKKWVQTSFVPSYFAPITEIGLWARPCAGPFHGAAQTDRPSSRHEAQLSLKACIPKPQFEHEGNAEDDLRFSPANDKNTKGLALILTIMAVTNL